MDIIMNDNRIIDLDEKNILANNIIFPNEYNPHNVRLWIIGHELGAIVAVWAPHEQEAFDILIDENLGGAFLVDEEDLEEDLEYVYLGNAGEPCNLEHAWIETVNLKKQAIELLLKFAEARGGCYDNLDF